MKYNNIEFNDTEMVTILELARISLSDSLIADYFTDRLDITDEELKTLSEKVNKATSDFEIPDVT